MDENFFSWESLNEMAGIQSHIAYVNDVLRKYQWDPAERMVLHKQLDAIRSKQSDKALNISVIGEFSTGKSSFINALVGCELLAVNALQGTTVAITVIEYDPSYTLTLMDKGEHAKVLQYTDIVYLRQALQYYTTNPSYVDTIDYVKVGLPSDILKQGFRIIDTPGTNSLEQWHEEITRKALSDISDMSVILVDSSHPMPETLNAFIQETIGGGVKDCLFVTNKIDTIRAKERGLLLKFVQKKIDSTFGTVNAQVIPFSAVALTNMFLEDKVKVDEDSTQLTYASLQLIFSFAAQKRVKTQSRKILHLIEDMYASLNVSIKMAEKTCSDELNELNRIKQTDLGPFINGQVLLRQNCFLDSTRDMKSELTTYANSQIQQAIMTIQKKIDGHTGTVIEKLSAYVKQGQLVEDIQQEGANIVFRLESKFSQVVPLFNEQITLFQVDFEKEFRRLALLPVKFSVKRTEVSVQHSSHTADIGPVKTFVKDELSKENWSVLGGIAAGAAIGSVIPVIGTVVGGFIGLFVGTSAAPDSVKVAKAVKKKLNAPLQTYFEAICREFEDSFSLYISDVSKNIETEIVRYYSAYNLEIQKRLNDWNDRYSKVQEKMRNIQNEISTINIRMYSINNVIEQLDK